METRILEDTKAKLLVEFTDGPSIALNVLKSELWNDSHTKIVGTHHAHPLVNKEKLILETDGNAPRKSIIAAAKAAQKDLDKASASLKGLK